MLDFPASPTNGATYSAPNGVVYTWQTPPGRWNDAGGTPLPGELWLTPDQFGASPALVDNAVPLQAWIDALIATGQPGLWLDSYASSTGLVVTGNVTIQCGPDAVLDIRTAATGAVVGIPGAVAIRVDGGFNAASGVALTAPVPVGTKTVSCLAGQEVQFTAGSLVKINSGDLFDPARGHTWKGELAWVESVAPGAITLETTTMDSYTTTPKIHLVTPVRFSITGGLRIIGTKNPSHSQQGIIATHVANSLIAGVTCEGISSLNIGLNNAIDSEIVRCNAIDALHGITGYGFAFSNSCQGCHIFMCRATNVRHATTVGGDAYVYDVDNPIRMEPNPLGGVCRDCTIEKLRADSIRNDGVDTHGNVDRLTLRDIVVNDCGGQGVNTEGGSIWADGVVVRRAGLGGFNIASGAGEVKTDVSARNIVVEDCGGTGISIGTAPHPDYPVGTPRPEPAGIGSVHLTDFRVTRSAAVALRIRKPPPGTPGTSTSFLNEPEEVKVSHGFIEDCGETLCVQFDYINNFLVEGLTITGIENDADSSAKAIGFTQSKRGTIRDCQLVFIPGAGNSALGFVGCTDVGFGGIKVTAPSALTLRAVSHDTTNSGLRSLGDNQFGDCSILSTLTTLIPVAGVLTVPAIIAGVVYRLGDEVTPHDIRTIAGIDRGDRIAFAGSGGTALITFRSYASGADNLQMIQGRDAVLALTTDTIEFRYDELSARCYQTGLARAVVQPVIFTTGITLPLYLDRGEAAYNSASPGTFTLPNSYQRGYRCQVMQVGAGQITFAAAVGSSLTNRAGHTRTAGPWAVVFLEVRLNTGGAAADWVLSGDTVA